MNILTKLFEGLTSYCAGLSSETIQFWLRLVCLLTLPIIACAWTFKRGFRSVFTQLLAGFFGVLVALSLPLQRVQIQGGMARVWFLTFAILFVAFTPVILPALLLPTLGAQQRLRRSLYFAVGALIIANLIWG